MLKLKLSILLLLTLLFLDACSATSTQSGGAEPLSPPPFPKILKPFGKLTCSPFKQVIFCKGGVTKSYDRRVPSFDGVPLDADLTLPAATGGPFKLIVMLHGLGDTKTAYEVSASQPSPPPGSNSNVGLAKLGFAVLNYTARGFGESCGDPTFRTKACSKGWQHLVDQRFEIRDTQYLSGLLVDEGIVKPTIGVMGVSYGAGQSVQLALLKNRVRLLDGKLVPWVSPKDHIPMQVGAAFVMWGWFNLVQALAPEGNFVPMQTKNSPYGGSMIPKSPPYDYGPPLKSWLQLLIDGTHLGYLAPPGVDPTANIVSWGNSVLTDNVNNPALNSIVTQLSTFKSGSGIPIKSTVPAPIYMANGFTDPLFSASQALELYSYIKSNQPSSTIDLFLGDIGHNWADNPSIDSNIYVSAGLNFLTGELNGKKFPTSIKVMPVACQGTSLQAPQLNGATFNSLNSTQISASFNLDSSSSVISSVNPNQTLSNSLNDLNGDFCHNVSFIPNLNGAIDLNLTGYFNRSTAILGSPIVSLNFSSTTNGGEIVGRLFDVQSNGSAQLITRGVTLFKKGHGSISFGLNPIYFQPANNSKIILDLVGSDSPSYRTANINGSFTATLSKISITVPTAK